MRTLLFITLAALPACITAPDQKLADGQAGCVTVSSVYGSVSSVVSRADNPGKGGGAGKTRITCGSAVMEVEHSVGAAQPASAAQPLPRQ